jgi:hypothetical protein
LVKEWAEKWAVSMAAKSAACLAVDWVEMLDTVLAVGLVE